MKSLKVQLEVNIIHVQKKLMKEKETGKEMVYYEYIIEAPSLFEGAEKITSAAEFKAGKNSVKLGVSPKGEDLKIRILKPETLQK